MTVASKSPVPRPAEVAWYYAQGDARIGPFTEAALLQALRQGLIRADTLVWQQAFDRWKQAACIPMLAVNLSEYAESSRRSEPNRPQLQESARAIQSEPLAYEELTEAVTDEEAEEPAIDAEQVREILQRASRPPPENSIPPASVTSTPVALKQQHPRLFGRHQWLGIAAGSLVLCVVAGMFVTRRAFDRTAAPVVAIGKPAGDSSTKLGPTKAHEEIPAPPTEARSNAGATGAPSSDLPMEAGIAVPKPADTTVVTGRLSESTIIEHGTLDPQQLVYKLRHGLPMYDQQCWDKFRAPVGEIAKQPSVRFELSIDRTGHVYDITLSKAPSGYRGVGSCIAGRMRGWKFPRAEAGTRAVVTVTRLRG